MSEEKETRVLNQNTISVEKNSKGYNFSVSLKFFDDNPKRVIANIKDIMDLLEKEFPSEKAK